MRLTNLVLISTKSATGEAPTSETGNVIRDPGCRVLVSTSLTPEATFLPRNGDHDSDLIIGVSFLGANFDI
jgi:hypothetical protein